MGAGPIIVQSRPVCTRKSAAIRLSDSPISHGCISKYPGINTVTAIDTVVGFLKKERCVRHIKATTRMRSVTTTAKGKSKPGCVYGQVLIDNYGLSVRPWPFFWIQAVRA